MNALEASSRVSELTNKIDALEKVTMNLESNRDFSYERRVIKEIQDEMKEERNELKEKLRSVTL